jgi:hypothetical protein
MMVLSKKKISYRDNFTGACLLSELIFTNLMETRCIIDIGFEKPRQFDDKL